MVDAALLFAALLQMADALTTARIIRLGGAELNPVVARLIARLGIRQALLLKTALALGAMAAGQAAGLFARVPWAAVAIAAMGLAALANNLAVIVRLHRLGRSHWRA